MVYQDRFWSKFIAAIYAHRKFRRFLLISGIFFEKVFLICYIAFEVNIVAELEQRYC